MNGREHMFWSLISFSIGMFVFTDMMNYRNASQIDYIAVLIVFAAVLLFNESGNVLVERMKRATRNKKPPTQEKSKDEKKIVFSRMYAYICLCGFIGFMAWFAAPATDNLFFLVGGFTGAFLGGHLPDFDKDIVDGDMRYHRNPITHSGMLVMPIALLGLLAVEDDYVSVLLTAIGINLGLASHCFADNFETDSTLSQIFIDFAHFKKCPGDIRHIKASRNHAWLNFHGAMLIFISILLFARFELSGIMEYPQFWDGWNYVVAPLTMMSGFIVLFVIAYYVLSFVMLITWRKEPKAAKRTRKVKQES